MKAVDNMVCMSPWRFGTSESRVVKGFGGNPYCFRIVYDIGKNSCYAFTENCCRFSASLEFLKSFADCKELFQGSDTILFFFNAKYGLRSQRH